jgi:hypothetical protein
VLAVYRHIEDIPDDEVRWAADGVTVRSAAKLAATLRDNRDDAALFKRIATVATDVSEDLDIGAVDDWEWRGVSGQLGKVARELGMPDVVERAERIMLTR